jgi:hypothetical protein
MKEKGGIDIICKDVRGPRVHGLTKMGKYILILISIGSITVLAAQFLITQESSYQECGFEVVEDSAIAAKIVEDISREFVSDGYYSFVDIDADMAYTSLKPLSSYISREVKDWELGLELCASSFVDSLINGESKPPVVDSQAISIKLTELYCRKSQPENLGLHFSSIIINPQAKLALVVIDAYDSGSEHNVACGGRSLNLVVENESKWEIVESVFLSR